MADLPPASDSTGDTGDDTGTPRWVKVFGTIALIVVLVFVTLLLTRGPHHPSRHMPSGDTGGHTSSAQHP